MRVRGCGALAALAGVVGGMLALVAPGAPVVEASQPKPGHAALVPAVPRTTTPRIGNGEIFDIEVSGNTVYVLGTFTSIADAGGATINQPKLAAWNLSTGKVITTFRPTFDGELNAVEASPDGTGLYVAGSFNTVNGVAKRKVAKINPGTGATIAAFTANASARATALAVSSTTVYVGGQFQTVNGTRRVGLAALDPTTGAVDAAFDNQLSGGIGLIALLTVQQLKLTHDDAKLLVVHTARQIRGQDRYGVALIDTSSKQLLPWKTRLWQANLVYVGGVVRAYAADISPDDSYFVVTSGSGGDRPPINDTAMAFPVAGGDDVQPLWVSRHFDSVYSVAITERAVYVGGHFSWQEAPGSTQPWPGLDNVGYGTGQGNSGYGLGDDVVRRDHLGALDPADGTALEWNPGSNSFEGVKALEATSTGLIMGGDGKVIGGRSIGRIGYFALADLPAPTAVDTTITAPIEGRVVASGQPTTITGVATANPRGVNQVQVAIQDRTSKRYLQDDLTTWTSTSNTIAATVATPRGITSTWSLTVSVPPGAYQINAQTRAVGGVADRTKATKTFEAFNYDDARPTTAIVAPAAGFVTAGAFTVNGTAADDHGVTALSYWVRNQANQWYLQADGTFAPAFHTFSAAVDRPGAQSTTWSIDLTLPEGQFRTMVTAVDTIGQPDLRGDTRDWTLAQSGMAPVVTITAPAAMTPPTPAAPVVVTPGGTVTFRGTATDDRSIAAVAVMLRNLTTGEALASDGTWGLNVAQGYYRVTPLNLDVPTYEWTWTSPVLSPGIYDFRVVAVDDLGLIPPLAAWPFLTLVAQYPGDATPNALLGFAGTDQAAESLHLELTGTATDDRGVAAVRIAIRDLDTSTHLAPDGQKVIPVTYIDAVLASPGATSTAFSLSIDLPAPGEWSVTAYAVDTAGQTDTSTAGAAAKYLIYPGDLDPTLSEALASPANGTSFAGRIVVGGRATDDVGISAVQVQIVNGAGQSMTSSGAFTPSATWVSTFLTSAGTPGSNYNYTSPTLPPGTYVVRTRAIDNYGQVQQIPREVTVSVTA